MIDKVLRAMREFRIFKPVLFLAVLWFLSQPLQAEIKALWLMAWDITTPEAIDEAVDYATEHNFNQLLVHIRYRSDALYQPNRFISRYPNPEPVSYILPDPSFDPLAYIIEKTRDTGIEVHAWTTVFIATPRSLDNISPEHIYNTRPEWITRDFFQGKMAVNSHQGAYLDPGIPEVHDYLINIFKDITVNYDIKGLHLDYIRYPGNQYGFAEEAMINYYSSSQAENFSDWRQEQITRFVRRCYAELKYLNPQLIVSAAVISCLDRAENRYSQNWTNWLDEGIVDYVYTMTYGLTDDAVLHDLRQFIANENRTIIGLRAWNEPDRPFSAGDVNSKIRLVRRKNKFSGLALFSYSGLKEISGRSLRRMLNTGSVSSEPLENRFIFGYAVDKEGSYIRDVKISINSRGTVFTDSNGFFFFSGKEGNIFELRAEKGKVVFFSDRFSLPDSPPVSLNKYDIRFPLKLSP